MAAGLPQPFVAAKLGVSQQSVSRYENGKSFPRPEALFQLLRLYGCTLKAGRR
jgi:transcriptional regulator with XRE-family HTH domain